MTILLKSGPERLIKKEYMIIQPDISEEEFWEYANEDSDCELIEGDLYIHSPASEEHEDIFSYLMGFFRYYLGKTNLGKVYGSRFVMRLSKCWNPEPDLMIIRPNNYSKIKENKIEGAADLVIEILSPSTRDLDLNKKVPKFLDSGVKEVWILDPNNKSISILGPSNSEIVLNKNHEEDIMSSVLGKVPLRPKWIWNREKYPIHQILEN